MTVNNTFKGGDATLYREVRAGFLVQGTSLHAWCRQEGIKMQNARAALLGSWKGPKASALVRKVFDASKALRP